MEKSEMIAEVLYSTFFKDTTGGTYIECTLYNTPICGYIQEKYGWKGYNLHPFLENFKELEENRPLDVNINSILSYASGKLTMKDVDGNKIEVKSTTYDNFVVTNGLKKIDLMVLSVDGGEFNVIERFFLTKKLPKVICIDTTKASMDAITTELLDIGYEESEIELEDNKIFEY